MNLLFRLGSAKMLFVVGHMRSGSTLLVHLLVDHPEIIGFGETKRTYSGPSDFGPTAYRVYRSFGRFWPRGRYVVDEVLHDEFGLDPRLLDRETSRTIFILRDPRQALPSILGRTEETRTSEGTAAYYIGRLEGIGEMAASIRRDRWTFLTYGGLISETDPTFGRIESLLRLSRPLDGSYSPIWATGRKGIGDDSARIRRGRIVRERRRERPDLDAFSRADVRRAMETFEETVVRLQTAEIRS